jgi:hypothetical protein
MLLVSILIVTGCGTLSRQTELMEQTEDINISAMELGNRLNNFNYRFAAFVENAADEIITQTDDPVIRKNALLWKMNSIPVAQEAIFRDDPMAGLIEISTFSIQMELFFSEGTGRDLFGKLQPIAIDAVHNIQEELREIWKKARSSGDLKNDNQSPIYAWARKNPIENLTFTFRSISDTLVTSYSEVDYGLQESIGGIAVGIYDIRQRLSYYTAMIPKQARWQAEYLIDQKLQGVEFDKAIDNLTRITDTIEKSPELIRDLQTSTLAEISRERIAVISALQKERLEVLKEINRQRLETLDNMQKLMVTLSGQVMSQTRESAESIIDHFFWRMAQLLLVGGVLVVIVMLIFRYLPPPRQKRA